MLETLAVIQNSLPELSAAGLFVVFFFGTFVSEDASCLLAGTAAASGRIGFPLALIACFLGIFTGDVLLYGVGRSLGTSVFDNWLVKRFVSTNTKLKASAWLEKNGAAAIFLSRFVTGLRLPTYLAAGALRTNFPKFAFYFLLASAVWTPILVGSTAFSTTFLFPKNLLFGWFILIVVIRTLIKYSSWKNRRLFVGRLKRIYNWEFWPLPIFYVPVIVYVIWLAFKHRSLTVFTAANPSVLAGGFKGESKNDIYERLCRSDAARDHLLSHWLLKAEVPVADKLLEARNFIDCHRIEFPVIVKPDVGERGKDVRRIRSYEELENELFLSEADLILQEFAAGEEVSIFYYRYPNAEHGSVFSITEKRFPVVIGDGKSNVEDLILIDRRAVCLAQRYFEQNLERLEYVPGQGEEIRLIDIGTHSRGALFMDGKWLKTDALERKIDEICRGFTGFYFGRFDIRTPSLDALITGEDFKILELNGVTSESTNIYDPQYRLFDAYRILFRQWSIACEIGVINRERGVKPSGMLDLLRLAFGRQIEIQSCPLTTDY